MAARTKSGNRDETKAHHRQMLIDATLDSISEIGIAETSVTKIITRAGLSRGMIHLHFKSKDHLMIEAAKHASEDYFTKMHGFLAAAGGHPADILETMVTADLSDVILNRRAINIWYAFRGEARSSNEFARYSDTRDASLRAMLFEAFKALSEGRDQAEQLALDMTVGTTAMTEGMWSDFFLHSDDFDRAAAKSVVMRFLRSVYPSEFKGH